MDPLYPSHASLPLESMHDAFVSSQPSWWHRCDASGAVESRAVGWCCAQCGCVDGGTFAIDALQAEYARLVINKRTELATRGVLVNDAAALDMVTDDIEREVR